MLEAAGFEPVTPHERRHAFASYCIASGMTAKAISKLLARASVDVTLDRYGHLCPGHEADTADRGCSPSTPSPTRRRGAAAQGRRTRLRRRARSAACRSVATLVHTSGTTGPAKGAMNLHRNVTFASTVWRDWPRLGEADVNLAVAPLFHIAGLIAGLGASLAAGAPLVLGHRFDAAATLELVAHHRPTFAVAAITAYQALMPAPGFAAIDFSCLRAAYTGGAPVAPPVAAAWRDATGVRLHNAYGLTETTSPLTLTPLGAEAPVDPASGALSVGVPVSDSRVEILGDDGAPLPPGEAGEIVATGPQVVPGYWGKDDETAAALPDGRLRTGDVGYVDRDGWVYPVDRRKDLIVASRYKVWPREVEDVLYAHPAVREVAVVGVPDSYRGETVKAYVSLEPGAAATPDELAGHCRERIAAYKYPRSVEIVDELSRSASGKVLRRELRDRAATEA